MKKNTKLLIVFIISIVISITINICCILSVTTKEITYSDNTNISSTSDPDYINGVFSSSKTLSSKIGSASLAISDSSGSSNLSYAVNRIYVLNAIKTVSYKTCNISSGGCVTVATPATNYFSNYKLPIIQPLYNTNSAQVAWSYSIVSNSNSAYTFYTRVGTTTNTTTISYMAFYFGY